ncbi:chorismate lyase [Limnobacter sp.]|uniref:chorismate--pyruvate lyase family protein n=1 Tax=Limnobacter sp. TaxID=2003368 RepID=UPI0035120C72
MNGAVVWHGACPPAWPAWARNWATTRGSLTQRLLGLGLGFEVQPVMQGLTNITAPNGQPAQSQALGRMRCRRVRLKVAGEPVVLAQTLVTLRGPRNDWRFWRGLGQRSLGSVLFADPTVVRGPLFFASLPARHPWVLALLDQPEAARVLQQPAGKHWYARCARFERRNGHTPLWVMEVFLPQLQHHC